MQIQSLACSLHDRAPRTGYRIVDTVPAVSIDRWRTCETYGCRNWSVSLVTETDEPDYTFQENDPVVYLIGAGIAAVVIGAFAGVEAVAERRAAKRAKAAVEDTK